MNKRVSSIYLFLSLILFFSCNEKEPVITPQPRGGNLTIKLNHLVNGKTAAMDQYLYMTAEGDSFQVTLLQYYLSNFELHSPESGWIKESNYQLIRLKDPGTFNFSIEGLAFGNYDSLRFFVGIDSATNHDISKAGDLDAGYGMIWTWNSGFIFYMFEGKFVNDSNVVLPFAYHLGGDDYLMKYELPIANTKTLNASQPGADINLYLELDQLFRTPNLIELNKVALVSHTDDEPVLSMQMVTNLLDAFEAK